MRKSTRTMVSHSMCLGLTVSIEGCVLELSVEKNEQTMHKKLIAANMVLYCKEWEKTVRFYRDHLRLPVSFSTDWFVGFRLTANSRLSIADEKRSSIRSCGGKGVTLALETDDIEAVREHTKRIGLKPTEIRRHPWDARVSYLFDPEGHRIEIWQASKHSEVWDRNTNQM